MDRSLDREPLLQACTLLHATALGSGYVHPYAHQKKKSRDGARTYVRTYSIIYPVSRCTVIPPGYWGINTVFLPLYQ